MRYGCRLTSNESLPPLTSSLLTWTLNSPNNLTYNHQSLPDSRSSLKVNSWRRSPAALIYNKSPQTHQRNRRSQLLKREGECLIVEPVTVGMKNNRRRLVIV